MNILITGGSGFIGTRLVDELIKGENNITIFDKVLSKKYPKMTVLGDVRNYNDVLDTCRNIDIIYNLAAEHADDVTPLSLYEDVNVGGAINIIKAANAMQIDKIIFTSSVAIYGLNRGSPDENVKARPFNEYGRTKYVAETVFCEWASSNDLNSLVILRPSVVFGENNRGNVYNLMSQIANNKFIMIGNGTNRKSMSYVGNISAFLSSFTHIKSGVDVYNFADKPDLTSREIVDIIQIELNNSNRIRKIPFFIGILGGYIFDIVAVITRKKLPVSSIRVKKFTAETSVNANKLNQTKFKAPFSLEQGLRNMVNFEFNHN